MLKEQGTVSAGAHITMSISETVKRTCLHNESSNTRRIAKGIQGVTLDELPQSKLVALLRNTKLCETCNNRVFFKSTGLCDSMEDIQSDAKREFQDDHVHTDCSNLLDLNKSPFPCPDKCSKARLAKLLLHPKWRAESSINPEEHCCRLLSSLEKFHPRKKVHGAESKSELLVDDHVKDYDKEATMSSPKILRAFGGVLQPICSDSDILDTVFKLGLR